MRIPATINKIIVIILIAGAVLYPAFTNAATGSVQVRQPIGDEVPAPPTGGGGSAPTKPVILPVISDLVVSATSNTAFISWSTNSITLARLTWGQDREYRDGIITVEQFSKKHSTTLDNLHPNTKYQFMITVFDIFGGKISRNGEFITSPGPDLSPPMNVTGFSVSSRLQSILLSWVNPKDSDFDAVRVVRSDKFFPLDPGNGQIIYEGKGSQVDDRDIASGVIYYYSVFSRDKSGNYASGALGSAIVFDRGEQNGSAGHSESNTPVVDFKFKKSPTPSDRLVKSKDFTITHNQNTLSVDSEDLNIYDTGPIVLTVPKAELPSDTAFITASLRDQSNPGNEFVYLFNNISAENLFNLTLPALAPGAYSITVVIFSTVRYVLQQISFGFKVSQASINPNPEIDSADIYVAVVKEYFTAGMELASRILSILLMFLLIL